MNKFENYQHSSLDKKINPLVVAIREGMKINTPKVDSKLDKIISEITKNDKTGKLSKEKEALSNHLFKLALERIAKEDYSGPLPLDSDLSDKYYSLLKEDLFNKIKERSCFHDYKEIEEIIKELNKGALDNDRVKNLIDESMGLIDEDVG